MKAPLIGIERHRFAVDGEGVTTLVAFHGCPLRCRYCLNPQCNEHDGVTMELTPQELLDRLMPDNLYFLATGGGICFGGGEPLLRSEFIAEFARIKPPEWRITVETSLCVEQHHLAALLPVIDSYIIDIKDVEPNCYRSYTGADNALVIDNLRWLLAHDRMADRIIVRLPLIPGYNTAADRLHSRKLLADIGVKRFDELEYIVAQPCSAM